MGDNGCLQGKQGAQIVFKVISSIFRRLGTSLGGLCFLESLVSFWAVQILFWEILLGRKKSFPFNPVIFLNVAPILRGIFISYQS